MGTQSYQQIAVQHLMKHGPCLSGDLARHLQKIKKCNIESARMAVSRLGHPIKKLKGINFKDAQKFVYIERHFAGFEYKANLTYELKENNTAAGRALQAIEARGFIRENEFPIAAGSPINDIKKQLRDKIVLKQLTENQLLIPQVLSNGTTILLTDDSDFDPITANVKLNVTDLLLKKCSEWAIRIGFSSENTSVIRKENKPLPQFGLFAWDMTSPTYLNGLRQWEKDTLKPGFFAADAIISYNELTLKDLAAFKSKIEIIRSQKGMARFIPALIHLGMNKEALQELRSMGVMCLEPKSFGDEDLGRLILEVLSFFENMKTFFGDPERLNQLVSTMLTTEYGRLLNLAGPLYQMILALLYKTEGYYLEPGKKVEYGGEKAEIDIFVQSTGKKIISVETKGYNKGKKPNVNEIESWLAIKRPRIIKWYEANFRKLGYDGLSFEFVISSTFSKEDLTKLNDIASKSYKNYPVRFLDINYVHNLASKHRLSEISKNLLDYFG